MSEAFGVAGIGRIKHLLSQADYFPSHAIVQHLRGQQGDHAVMVILVVPREKVLAVCARILDGTEAVGELGHVFEGFELAFRVRIVVRYMWPAMSICHAQAGHPDTMRSSSACCFVAR
jgi:hypothetical protein